MFYYAEIDGDYLVINTHSLTESSTNANYVSITEEQYTSDDLVGKYYNSLYGQFEIVDWDNWVGGSNLVSHYETNMLLSTKIDNMQAEINSKVDANHIHEGYATSDHTHTEYASSDDLQVLEDTIATKADVTHTHEGYALSSHVHEDYATQVALNALGETVGNKADTSHTHSEYASLTHSHDEYSPLVHSHTDYVTQPSLDSAIETLKSEIGEKADTSHAHSEYASVSHLHDEYANVNHNHNSDYSPLSHSHDNYVTITDFDVFESEVSGKADANHSHTDYSLTSHTHSEYSEVGHSHSNYSVTTHNHNDAYSPLSHSHTASEIGAAVSGHNHDSDYAALGHNHNNTYSVLGHTHSDYVTVASLNELYSIVSGKADSSHNHDGVYDVSGSAASALTSANAYTDSKIDALIGEGTSTTLDTIGEISSAIVDNQDAIDLLNAAIANKANATDLNSHASDTEIHITDAERNIWNAKSNFSGNYNDLTNKPSIPSIDGLATETYVDEAVSTKADSGHNHNSVYYTETEVDSLLSAKANSSHNHNSSYDALGTAETKASAVQANLDVVSEDLVEHIDNANIHFTTAERTKLSGIAANANNYTHPNSGVTAGTYKSVTVNAQGHITAGTNPTTLAGYGITDAETKGAANSALSSAKAYTDELIADEVTNRDSAIATAKSSAISTAASDATTKANNALALAKTYADSAAATVKNDLLNNAGFAYDTLKELGDLIDNNADAIEALETIASGKANASHTHAISDITNLQSTLDGKASASHGTHVSYATTAPVMDGTASVGSASTVARSDHKHPTDTSRASQTSLDSHTSNKSNPHGVTLAQLGITATATELNALDGITATAAELNYVDGVTSNIQTQLNAKAASSHTHSYAGSSSVGGAATSANKLNTNAGSAIQPVYFANGIPVATTYTLGKSVPSNAVFTDTTYGAATTSANGLMSSSDKSKLDGMVMATVSEVETYLGI